MGTTINGVYEGGKRMRRVRALKRLEVNLKSEKSFVEKLFNRLHVEKMCIEEIKYTEERIGYATNNINRINKEIEILKSRI
jgi:hypothetical protein